MKNAMIGPLAVILACALSCSSPARLQRAESAATSPDLEPFLKSYFATWSAGDMRGYKDLFDSHAVVTYVDKGKVVWSLPRGRFVRSQADSRARSRRKAVERMTSFEADEDGIAATVAAHWEMVKEDLGGGTEVTRGVDRFTLIRDERGQWKILALVFYVTE